jgi:propanediol dehydratase small subunit
MTNGDKNTSFGGRRIISKTGVALEELLLERVAGGWGEMEDFSISRETLLSQAKVAASSGRRQLAENLRRAAELVQVPDGVILQVYEALRPYRSTRTDLAELARQLNLQFQAPECARWVEEAAEVYVRRGLLKPGQENDA